MSDLTRKIAGLSRDKRALLEALLDREGMEAARRPVLPAPRDGSLPLSLFQERLWFLDRMEPGNPAFDLHVAVRLRGDLDRPALAAAFDALVRRHESLRTTFTVEQGEPRQVIGEPWSAAPPVVDLAALPPERREAEGDRLTARALGHRFDLARGPLLLTRLLRLGEGEHLALLVVHHAVSDGWSMGILVRELAVLYGHVHGGGDPRRAPLPELPVQYADYAVWQRRILSGERLETLLDHWRGALEGAPRSLDLPTDRPRPAVQTFRGEDRVLRLDPGLSERLRRLAREEGASLYMVLLAGFGAVVGRLAGQRDVQVGSPVAGRPRPELEGLVGFLVNTLVMRADLGGRPGFRELVGRVRRHALDAYAHQDLPFEKLLEELEPERDLGRTPLFQVFFNMLNLPASAGGLPGLELEVVSAPEPPSPFDLTVYARDDGGGREGGIRLRLVSNADLFDPWRMEALLDAYGAFLERAAAEPEEPVTALSLVAAPAAEALPDPRRPLAAAAGSAEPLHAAFARRAAAEPDRLAVTGAAGSWTYGGLARRAGAVARRLRDTGVGRGDTVAVWGRRDASLPAALLGVLGAGGRFVVLDPAYPAERLARIVEAAEPRALLRVELRVELRAEAAAVPPEVPPEVTAALDACGAREVRLDPASVPLADTGEGFPVLDQSPDEPAYVAFTSGTTGGPKGIVGPHGPLAHFAAWEARELGLGAGDRVSLLSGLAHDPLLRDVLVPLALGAAVCAPDTEDLGGPGALAAWAARQRVTVTHLTPSMAQLLLEGAPAPLPDLRLAAFGGEVLTGELADRLRSRSPGTRCVNLYGATETPQGVARFEVPAGWRGPVPLGRGIDGVELLVLTPEDDLAGVGELGEIAVRSRHLAAGYLEEAPAAAGTAGTAGTAGGRFTANPFRDDPEDRIYRTGDLGRYRADGTVEYAGRGDEQVKVRGFRVEPAEVETALEELPGVARAAVVARELPRGRPEGVAGLALVAYVVAEGEEAPPAEELRAALALRLPDYMVPSAFVALEAIPRTPGGKVDRRALPAPGRDARGLAAYTPPRTPLEESLALLWAELLGVERVGADDRFFELGGHSLLATRVVARVEEDLGVSVPVRTLFERPDLAGFAARVEEALRAGREAPPPLVPVPRDEPLPVSYPQRRLWLLSRIDPGNPAYSLRHGLRFRGLLDAPLLARCLRRIERRHESLRTTFALAEEGPWAGEPVQVVGPPGPLPLPVVDLSGLPPERRMAVARGVVRAQALTPFDLDTGPLTRVRLLRLAATDHVLALTQHHVVSDAWSMGVLGSEITALYRCRAEDTGPGLPPLPVQYGDYAAWQRRWLAGETLEREVAVWRRLLGEEPPPLDLPTDRPRPERRTFRGGTRERLLPEPLLRDLRILGSERRATLFMTLLAGFATLLHRLAGAPSVRVGTPVANRRRPELEGLVGFFANTLVLPADLSVDPRFGELLEAVRETALEAYAHSEVPFEALVEALRPDRDLARSPLFEVLLVLQNAPRDGGEGIPGVELEALRLERERVQFDLILAAYERPDGLRLVLDYNADLFDAATASRLLGQLDVLLRAAAADPDLRAGELPLLAAAERHQVLREWSGARAPRPEDTLHGRFEEQARRTPDGVALVAPAGATGGGTVAVTYGELSRRASASASRLRRRGAGTDRVVALAVDDPVERVTALLAVLGAGAAYLPLDPEWPRERIEETARDAGVELAVADGGVAEVLGAAGVECLDPAAARAAAGHPPAPGPVPPEAAAYVFYTSGSTGRPKGVVVPHGAACATLGWRLETFRPGPGDAVLQNISPTFDPSVWQVFGALHSGARLHLVAADGRSDFAGLARRMAAERITVTDLAPSMLDAFLEQEAAAGATALRLLFAGGEALPGELAARFRGRFDADLRNIYGPTEAAIDASCHRVGPADAGRRVVPIGRPAAGKELYVVDPLLRPLPPGVPGELVVGGELARGYLARPALTAERFVPDPFSVRGGTRLYRTGDAVRWLGDGTVEFLGRLDHQVKVRGHRVEPGEIEAALRDHPGVREAAVLAPASPATGGDRRLVAYVAGGDGGPPDADALRRHLAGRLPAYMVPGRFVPLPELPRTAAGKVDRRALQGVEPPATPANRPAAATAAETAPRGEIERVVAEVWRELLGEEGIGLHDNFFELGGHSLLLVKAQARLQKRLGREIPIVEMFAHPSIAALSRYLAGGGEAPAPAAGRSEPAAQRPEPAEAEEGIAIVGMAGRFPGAGSVDELWRNLCDGVEGIRFFDDRELAERGVPEEVRRDPRYVPAQGTLDDADLFDAGFFGYSPREAEILDPQQRLFLETAWQALESAGYAPGGADGGAVGVFGGVSANHYLLRNLLGNPEVLAAAGGSQAMLGSDKDFLATRVAYKLDLQGPAFTVQTACSTSLVAVHLACEALRSGDCDMALAGGVSVGQPQGVGYLPPEGGILSPDGHCRAFDARGRGTVSGNGVAVVVLKPLAAARRDGDRVVAVVRGSAINNDGAGKVGYTAPGVDGQAKVIAAAQRRAGVDPGEIGYVEAHGTATPLGDPVEVAALERVFRPATERTGFCALGSIKTNIGHLDAAAGVSGLIKAALALHHRRIPPSLHFERPNPRIDLDSGPFYVPTRAVEWESPDGRRRWAGVSSFGIGGTNAHAVLQEAPPVEPRPAMLRDDRHLLVLSARGAEALERATDRLGRHLEGREGEGGGIDLGDVAFTLQAGRRAFAHRRALVVRGAEDAARALADRDPERMLEAALDPAAGAPPVVFLFPGQGAQYPGMARGLYETEPLVRTVLDECAEVLDPELGVDLRGLLFPDRDADPEEAARRLEDTALTQPALLSVEYALARLWTSWGVEPEAMLGHSVGEYAAACLAGVMTLEEALRLVAARGRLMASLPPGAMAAVPLAEEELARLLEEHHPEVALAAVNAPGLCVVSGPEERVAELEQRLAAEGGTEVRRLHTSHAFHSGMMEPILEPFRREAAKADLRPPRRRYLSNVTGDWVLPEEATDPGYWVRHLRSPVRLAGSLARLLADDGPRPVLLEVGPGRTLSTLARRQGSPGSAPPALPTLRHPRSEEDDRELLLTTLGRLWLAGVEVDWRGVHAGRARRRAALPTYPFERRRYWVDPAEPAALPALAPSSGSAPAGGRAPDVGDWFHRPVWTEAPLPMAPAADPPDGEWLLFADEGGVADALVGVLRSRASAGGAPAVRVVRPGGRFEVLGEGEYALRPGHREDYSLLAAELGPLARVIHLWGVDPVEAPAAEGDAAADRGLYSMLWLAQALGESRAAAGGTELEAVVVTGGVEDVLGDEPLEPAKATVVGACLTIPRETPGVTCRRVDVVRPERGTGGDVARRALAVRLLAEVERGADADGSADVVALRGGRRWLRDWRPVHLPAPPDEPSAPLPGLVRGGVYLVTGGLGGLGLEISGLLARRLGAKLVLVSRSGLPERPEWERVDADERPELHRRIDGVRRLEAAGAEVAVVAADVADPEAAGRAVAVALERFGGLHGVVHAAGVPGGGALQLAGRDDVEPVLAPKVAGTRHLAAALDRAVAEGTLAAPPELVVLFSSLASVLGGAGQVAYTAANAYLDAFAAHRRAAGDPSWMTIQWDAWREVGMAAGGAGAEEGIAPEEGAEAFLRAVTADGPDRPARLAVSTTDLRRRLRRARAPSGPAGAAGAERRPAAGGSAPHARPDGLARPYAAPRNRTEERLAAIWEEVLGLDRVGIHDEFGELGGHSLLAIQVVSRAREAFEVDLPLSALFETPTVARMAVKVLEAEAVEALEAAPEEEEDLDALLERMDELSDDEVAELLAASEGEEDGDG